MFLDIVTRMYSVIEFGFQIIFKIAVWLFGFVDPMVYNLVVSSRENSKHYLLV
jgi:hypothetical protein